VPFVEPQYDSTGEFPLAVLHHYLLTNDMAFLKATQPRVNELMQFFLDNVSAAARTCGAHARGCVCRLDFMLLLDPHPHRVSCLRGV